MASLTDAASLRSAMTLRTRRPNGCSALRCRMVTSWSAARSRLTSSLPMNSVPPITRTRMVSSPQWKVNPRRRVLVVVLQTEVRNQLLALHPAKRIFQFHRLNENIVLGIEAGRGHGRFEKEREPLLHAAHSGALGEVHKQHDIEYQRC